MSLIIIGAQCHCRLNTLHIAFNPSSLPISGALCHCNACRHSTGQMAALLIPFDGVPLSATSKEPADLGGLIPYQITPKTVQYFCSECSAHILRKESGRWKVAVGALKTNTDIGQISCHTHILETQDGGFAEHLREIGGVAIVRYSEDIGSPEVPIGWRKREITESRIRLRAYCSCKTIAFEITPPSTDSFNLAAPYPDLLKPYDVTHLSTIRNPKGETWWLWPRESKELATHTKYLAGHCACTSCRTSSGFPIQSWAFIPRCNIVTTGSNTTISLEGSLRPKGLKQYISSPGRYRECCETCGATVFWWEISQPELVYVSVGLLDQDEHGARAESWLAWHKERVSFSEDALNQERVQGLLQGLSDS